MTVPFVVVEAGPAALADARGELESRGWEVIQDLPTAHRRGALVLAMTVTDADAASAALLAAIEGVGLLIHAAADRAMIDRLCDDLRRLGHLDHRVASGGPFLTVDERALLDLLADGQSLGAAATALHLARRSADRRLAAARTKLDAESTGQAIAAYRRRLDRIPRPA